MKKQISALILCLVLCFAAVPASFAASEESTITVSLTQLAPGYYLGAVWDGDELLTMFDHTVGSDGKLETTVGVGKVYPQGKELKVGISSANAGGAAIPPVTCKVGESTPSTPSQPTTPTDPDTPTTPGTSTYYTVNVPSVTGGSISVSQTRAAAGTVVYITVYENSNYEPRELYAVNSWGQEVRLYRQSNGTYVFTMPASSVSIRASFDRISSDVFYPSVAYYPAVTNTSPNYTGVSQWHYANNWIYNSAGTVSSDTRLTRDMLLSILYHLDSQTADNPTFWATKTGIIGDYWNAGLSGSDKAVSQDQIAYLLFNYAGYRGYNTSARNNSNSGTARPCTKEAYSWANAIGLFSGESNPKGYVTIGQMSATLRTFFGGILY